MTVVAGARFHVPERFRMRRGQYATDASAGNNGAFHLPGIKVGCRIWCIVSDGAGWEHVSARVPGKQRTPTWEEMCYVKALMWDPEAVVLQYHPPESLYVNCHRFTLHLWRAVDQAVPVPDPMLVGPLGSARGRDAGAR